MNITYNDGKLSIELTRLLEHIPTEDKLELIEELACEDDIIKHVADQIVEGFTENDNRGSRSYPPYPYTQHSCPLDVAIRRIAKAANDIAKQEIEQLENALIRLKEANDKMAAEYQKVINSRTY